MKTLFASKYKGFKIELTYENPDRVSFRILRDNGSLMDGTEDNSTGYDVTDSQCIETAHEIIDDYTEQE